MLPSFASPKSDCTQTHLFTYEVCSPYEAQISISYSAVERKKSFFLT